MHPVHRQDGLYRMPYGFGPTCGPRQGPDGKAFDWTNATRRTIATSFLSDAACLERLLPPGFSLFGEPVVTVEFHVLGNLAWLAGRGYSMLQVKFPARFAGARDAASGSFMSVLWEDLADPILSGREELGFAKLWCDLPPPRGHNGRIFCHGSWLSHVFAEIEVSDLEEAPAAMPPMPGLEGLKNDGILHYKYFPATQDWGEAAVAHACLSPAGGTMKVERLQLGKGTVRFAPTSWDQMPTQFHIISALAALPQIEDRGARVIDILGGSDYADQRRLD